MRKYLLAILFVLLMTTLMPAVFARDDRYDNWVGTSTGNIRMPNYTIMEQEAPHPDETEACWTLQYAPAEGVTEGYIWFETQITEVFMSGGALYVYYYLGDKSDNIGYKWQAQYVYNWYASDYWRISGCKINDDWPDNDWVYDVYIDYHQPIFSIKVRTDPTSEINRDFAMCGSLWQYEISTESIEPLNMTYYWGETNLTTGATFNWEVDAANAAEWPTWKMESTLYSIGHSADFTEDWKCNIHDVVVLASFYGKDVSEEGELYWFWNSPCWFVDINCDGTVNIFDTTYLTGQYGKY